MSSTNIQIAIKVRPFIEREKRDKLESLWLVKENSIVQIDSIHNFIGEAYSFDHIFDHRKSNRDVYDAVVKPLVKTCLEGINSTIFAYGQTSSGKTHTMLGDNDIPGIINFTVEDIFSYIEENTTKDFLLRGSYLEIYNEKINDLLDTRAKNLKIREDYNQVVHVDVKEEVIRKPEELFNLMRKGMKTRKIGCTDMNERSSRSHTIFRLVIQSQNKDSEGSYTESTLSLVDLAGSERVGQMNMGRMRQVEGVSINKSLTTLGIVIRKLSDNEAYINYRDSKLTRLLQHSLGGNSRTLIIATITTAVAEETKSTLEFAQRAKYVKNRPIINERVTDREQLKQYEHLCQDYKEQIAKLRMEQNEKDQTINALEDKICNIKLFTAGNLEKCAKPYQIPTRRHTLAHYKPHKTFSSNGGLENSNNEEPIGIISPVNSEVCFRVTNADDKENSIFDYSNLNSPYNLISNNACIIPETPNLMHDKRRGEEEEDPFIDLKCFTDIENQLQSKNEEVERLQQLNELLQNEISELRKENSRISENYITIVEVNKSIYAELIILKNILEVKPLEQMKRKSLDPILEEDSQISNNETVYTSGLSDEVLNQVKKTYTKVCEENEYLKLQINEKDIIIEDLKNNIGKVDEEVAKLKMQIDSKNANIDQLKASIIKDRNEKESELEMLNSDIKSMNDYKELMHEKLSSIQKEKELYESEEISTCKLENVALKQDIENLSKELDSMRQLSEHDAFKIKALMEELQSLKTLGLKKEKEDSDEESCLKSENARLKSELEDAVFQLNGEQKELEICFQQLEEKTKDIRALKQLLSKMENNQELCEKIHKLNNTNLSLQEQILKKEEQIQIFEEKVHGYLKDIQVLQTTCEDQKNETKELKKQLQSKIEEYQQCVNEVKGNEKRLNECLTDNVLLKQNINNYLKNIEKLQAECETRKDDLAKLNQQLHLKVVELDDKTDLYNELLLNNNARVGEYQQQMKEIENLKKEKVELKQYLDNHLSLQQAAYKYQKELQILQTTTKEQSTEILKLKQDLKTKSEEINESRHKLGTLEELENVLSDTKRQLKDRCQDIRRQKSKYDDLEIQLLNCKKDLSDKNRKFEMELTKKLELEAQLNEFLENSLRKNQKLEEAKQELKLKTEQLALAEEQYKLQFAELDQKHKDFEKRYSNLESQFNAKKNKVENLSKKLQNSESEITGLQAKINDLIQYKKLPQEGPCDKDPKSRLSDEGRPSSPNDLRRNKRHSLHDQRRGLTTNSIDIEDDQMDCTKCINLRTRLSKIKEENDQLTKDNKFLDDENEDMLKIIKSFRKTEAELHDELNKFKNSTVNPSSSIPNDAMEENKDCTKCIILRTRLSKIKEENDQLTKDNKFLDEENEDMLKIIKSLRKTEAELHDELNKFKNSTVNPSNSIPKLNDAMEENKELQNELLLNKDLIKKYKDKILQMESKQVEQFKQSQTVLCRADKGSQATCDMYQKYQRAKKIAVWRREEGNFLRSKLGLAPDCPVLPNDLQYQQQSSST